MTDEIEQELTATPEFGDVETAEATPEVSAPQALDIGEYGNHLVTIKVDGEEQQVPLSEAAQGYMRQAAFTRKTQEAANLKQEAEQGLLILDALSKDPREAIQYMAEHYGVQLGQPQAQPQQDALGYGEYEEGQAQPTVDPRIDELQAEIRALKQQNVQTSLSTEAASVREKYGIPPEDVEAAKRHMVLHGFPDVESAFKALHFDSAWEAKKAADAQRAQDAKILAEKRDNLGVVGTQASPARGSIPDHTPQEKLGVRGAMEEALRELNLGVEDLTTLD